MLLVGWLVTWVGWSSIVASSEYVDWFGLIPFVVTRNIEGLLASLASLASLLELMWWEWVLPSIVWRYEECYLTLRLLWWRRALILVRRWRCIGDRH